MTYHIADLHCDFLSYLALKPGRTVFDPQSRCAVPQLKAGGVALQTMAIFTPPISGLGEFGLAQAKIFRRLLTEQKENFVLLESPEQALQPEGNRVAVLAAIEGASSFCAEDGKLSKGFECLEAIEAEVTNLLYVSLTWNGENRFGGGTGARRGLKDDGRSLLTALAEKGIAVDVSHASHWLAADILEFSDAKGLGLHVLASHSNFQAVRDLPRNLPEEIAREIILRKGVIGLNFVRDFLTPESPEGFLANLRHALHLGGEESYCLGADFFADCDVPPAFRLRKDGEEEFLSGYGDSSCYPRLMNYLRDEADWPEGFLAAFANGNASTFIARVLASQQEKRR